MTQQFGKSSQHQLLFIAENGNECSFGVSEKGWNHKITIRVGKTHLIFGLTLAASNLTASLRLINSMHTCLSVPCCHDQRTNSQLTNATRENGKDTNGMNAYLRIVYTRYDVRDKLLFLAARERCHQFVFNQYSQSPSETRRLCAHKIASLLLGLNEPHSFPFGLFNDTYESH